MKEKNSLCVENKCLGYPKSVMRNINKNLSIFAKKMNFSKYINDSKNTQLFWHMWNTVPKAAGYILSPN